MALLHTPPKDASFIAPDFTLKNIDGALLSYNNIKGEKGTVIAFICNHCPYVQAIIKRFVETAKHLQDIDIGVAAIMPNDTKNYPADSFENMQTFAKDHHFTFPYLLDETQETAKAYGAVCTPDIFGFDAKGMLVYRGRLDSAGPNTAKTDTIPELLNAMVDIAGKGKTAVEQHSSMGCSIKWR
jgi:peroxiredoxin